MKWFKKEHGYGLRRSCFQWASVPLRILRTPEYPAGDVDKGIPGGRRQSGDEVQVTTAADRVETGTLVEVDPYYTHSYGKCVPELVQIDRNYRAFLYGGDK